MRINSCGRWTIYGKTFTDWFFSATCLFYFTIRVYFSMTFHMSVAADLKNGQANGKRNLLDTVCYF